MRSDLRAKISQKDYVDRDLKNYHYGKNGKQIKEEVMANAAQGNVAAQIAAAQHMLYLQQQHAQ